MGMTLENGWPECDLSDTERLTIPGTALSLPIRKGQPHAILQAFFRDVNEFIEPVMNARGLSDEGSWTENNSVYTSNHKGATAVDWNWSDHPVQIRDAGWDGSVLINGSQVPAMRELLAWYEGMVFWGNDWNSFIDSMHFQMGYNTFGAQNFDRVHSFIQRKIRADGFSTYRRGGTPRGGGFAEVPAAPLHPIKPTSGLTPEVLWRIAGGAASKLSVGHFERWFDELVECQAACGVLGNIDRSAMWYSQVFPESGNLVYTEEIASGAAYEGRCEGLGNCQPGDGVRFKGRSFMQVTGRSNYTKMSGWAHGKGYVPTPDYFVVHPDQLDDERFAFLGVTWYWTTQRPMNDAADARNLELATRYVNGGLTNLEGRRAVYNRALAENANLLLTNPVEPWEELMATAVPSLSIYANPGEPDVPLAVMLAALDAHGPHEPYVERQAIEFGDADSIRRIARTANGQGKVKTPAAIKQATDAFRLIPAEFVRAAIPA
ncbi:lysin A [Mycobacterium phage Julie1]|uniref:Lysin A n=1 Tax=Mycobacterium phage Julie1 TaxID=1463812 RepID=W8EEP3_9CAUD|nr:endolysin [Mycobacterium phage Julie1]AHJ88540.1 lysin A [Mycobacterium phage Julie1]